MTEDEMAFTQIMTVRGADEEAVLDLLEWWDAEQSGDAPGYEGARVLVDEQADEVLIEVDFASEEEARRNDDRPETRAWADKLRALVQGEPEYRDLRQAYTSSSTS